MEKWKILHLLKADLNQSSKASKVNTSGCHRRAETQKGSERVGIDLFVNSFIESSPFPKEEFFSRNRNRSNCDKNIVFVGFAQSRSSAMPFPVSKRLACLTAWNQSISYTGQLLRTFRSFWCFVPYVIYRAAVHIAAHQFPKAEADALELARYAASVLPTPSLAIMTHSRSDPPFIKSNIQFQGALSKRGEVNVAYKSRYFILTHNFFLFYYKSVNVRIMDNFVSVVL